MVAAPTARRLRGRLTTSGWRSAQRREILLGQMMMQVGIGDDARCDREGTNAIGLVAAIECQCEQRVGGFRLAVGVPAIVGLVLKIGIREVDVVKPVGPRAQHHQPRRRPCPQKRREPVDKDKVAEMVGAELHFESVCSSRRIDRHHPGICHDPVQSVIGRSGYARQRRECWQARRDRPAGRPAQHPANFPDRFRCGLAFRERTNGQNDLRAARGQHAGGLLAEA